MPYIIFMEESRKRLFISRKTNNRERERLIKLALENGCNTLIFSLNDKFFKTRKAKYIKLISDYELNVEAGGRDFPLLMPKKLFFSNRELFRMEHGKRKKSPHFCATNPMTTAVISGRAKFFLEYTVKKVTVPRVFHLLPDEKYENTWCACPACRAFRPAEQYIIAANTFADEIFKIDPDARLAFNDYDPEPAAARVMPRKNMFNLSVIR